MQPPRREDQSAENDESPSRRLGVSAVHFSFEKPDSIGIQRHGSIRAGFYARLVCVLLMAIFAATAWTAWLGKSPTFDEPLHLVSSWVQTHYFDFRCNPEDPPLWKYYVALGTRAQDMKVDRRGIVWEGMLDSMSPQGLYVPDTLFRTPGNDADALVRAGRLRMIALSLVLAALIGWWARRLAGPLAAVVAVAAFCLDPNFLAHGALIKNDVPVSLAFLALMASLWLLGERVTAWRCATMALLLGAVLTTKFSGVLAVPMVGAALLCRALLPQSWRVLGRWATTYRQRLLAAATLAGGALLVAYGFIWACYGFRFGPSADPSQIFGTYDIVRIAREKEVFAAHGGPFATDPQTFQQWQEQWKPSPAVRAFLWANAHRILPQPWLLGFLFTYATSRIRATFLLAQRSLLGWWYYFPLAMLFKTPLTTLVGLAIAAVLAYRLLWKRRSGETLDPPRNAWPFWAAAIAPMIYAISAITSHIDMGIRHVLPIYPFLFIFLGVIASRAYQRWPRIALPAVAAFILGLSLEVYGAYPNFIPFFNAAVGGWRGGEKLLSDSNIDWGQELIDLAKWQQKHPDRQLFLCYFGSGDPRYYGLHYVMIPGGTSEADQPAPSNKPAVYAISVIALQGTYLTGDADKYYEGFRKQQPTEALGGSIYLYEAR